MKSDRVVAALRSGAFGAVVLAAGAAGAQTRAECEAGIEFVDRALAASTDPRQRGTLEKALRDARRELGEEEYDECLEAVEDARDALGGGASEFLGTQGDVWDTQWDMFLATVGAILALLTLSRVQDRQLA